MIIDNRVEPNLQKVSFFKFLILGKIPWSTGEDAEENHNRSCILDILFSIPRRDTPTDELNCN